MGLPKGRAIECYQRDGWRCRHCSDRNALHPHHIDYKSHGGTDDLWNLLTLCTQCHRAHHDGFLKIAPVDWTIPATQNQVRFVRLRNWRPI
jgi:5-methylcytosine-specific restriction endonuclease McrA